MEPDGDQEEQEDSILRNETARLRKGHWISDYVSFF